MSTLAYRTLVSAMYAAGATFSVVVLGTSTQAAVGTVVGFVCACLVIRQ